MKIATLHLLLASVLLTGNALAAERPERTSTDRTAGNGTTTDEVVRRPERPTDFARPLLERPTVPDSAKSRAMAVRQNRTELDRIKEALKRLRDNNRNLTEEQIQRAKERLLDRARELVARAKSVKDRIKDLKTRFEERRELLDQAKEKRNRGRDAAKAATAPERD